MWRFGFKELVTMAAIATAFVRLSQSIAGTLSLSHCRTGALLHPCSNSIRRQNSGREFHRLFSSLDCRPIFPSSGPIKELHCRPSSLVSVTQPRIHRLQKRIECSASSGGDNEGSVFYSTATAAEASVAERSLYSGRNYFLN